MQVAPVLGRRVDLETSDPEFVQQINAPVPIALFRVPSVDESRSAGPLQEFFLVRRVRYPGNFFSGELLPEVLVNRVHEIENGDRLAERAPMFGVLLGCLGTHDDAPPVLPKHIAAGRVERDRHTPDVRRKRRDAEIGADEREAGCSMQRRERRARGQVPHIPLEAVVLRQLGDQDGARGSLFWRGVATFWERGVFLEKPWVRRPRARGVNRGGPCMTRAAGAQAFFRRKRDRLYPGRRWDRIVDLTPAARACAAGLGLPRHVTMVYRLVDRRDIVRYIGRRGLCTSKRVTSCSCPRARWRIQGNMMS